MTFTATNMTQRRARLALLARALREEADLYKDFPLARQKLIDNARNLTWTFRTLSDLNPNCVNNDVVDSLIDGAIETMVRYASARVAWKTTS